MVANMLIAECEAAERLNGDKAPANVQPQPSGPWHHDLGHIHPMKSMETAVASVEAGEVMREDVANALGLDIAEMDAENARDRERDQIAPGTWTTLGEVGVGVWSDGLTDLEEIVIAGVVRRPTTPR
jgi:hypothetical protein